MHDRGIVESEPGLYFIGMYFLYALSSVLIGGVGRDAEHVARHIEASQPVGQREHTRHPGDDRSPSDPRARRAR